jgi:methylated-DNA-protein-cysteine methyltransferase-like protein
VAIARSEPGTAALLDTPHHRSHITAMRRATAKPPTIARDALRPRIYAVVRRIPRGKVATYGQVAALAGFARHARQVGYALNDLPSGSDVPWHRVVNARGEVSPRAAPGWEEVQRDLLEQEEVYFGLRERIDLARYGWKPRTPRPRTRA